MAGFGALFGFAAAAHAHVTVDAVGATQGGADQVVTFRVPTESDTASTVGLKVQFPIDTPMAGVLVEPVAQWKYTVTTVKLAKPIKTDDGDVIEAVREVDWTATSGGIRPGGFGQFNVIVGQLPTVPSLTFKAIQTYSDKSTVSWVEVAGPGAAEPDHPAPTLALSPAAAGDAGGSTPPRPTPVSGAAPSVATSGAGSTGMASSPSRGASTAAVAVAIVLGVVGIGLGAAGLVVALTTRRRPG